MTVHPTRHYQTHTETITHNHTLNHKDSTHKYSRPTVDQHTTQGLDWSVWLCESFLSDTSAHVQPSEIIGTTFWQHPPFFHSKPYESQLWQAHYLTTITDLKPEHSGRYNWHFEAGVGMPPLWVYGGGIPVACILGSEAPLVVMNS